LKLETWFGSLMVFTGIVIMLTALTLSIVLTSGGLVGVTGNALLEGIFLTPPFFEVVGLILIILGKMHAQSEERKVQTQN
jgi:F0F1-type ATP synthase assembly protein I